MNYLAMQAGYIWRGQYRQMVYGSSVVMIIDVGLPLRITTTDYSPTDAHLCGVSQRRLVCHSTAAF